MINEVRLVGRLTRDPELRYTQNNLAFCYITVAVESGYNKEKKENITDFISLSVWGNLAENLQKYQAKGDLIYVAGILKNNVRQDEYGNKTYVLQVRAQNIKYLAKGKNNQNDNFNNSFNQNSEFSDFGQDFQTDMDSDFMSDLINPFQE